MRLASDSALISPTVYAPLDPRPVPAGTSASEAISSGSPDQWRSSVSRRIGCWISSIVSVSSKEEYFMR